MFLHILWGSKQMRANINKSLKSESGITLLILAVSIIIMLIIAVIAIGSLEPELYEKIRGANNAAEVVRSEQDREAQNAIDGLGGLK